VLNALCNLKLQGFQRFAAGIKFQATIGCVQSFGELVQGQTGGCSAIPCFDIPSVEFQDRCTVSVT
jgi:hypothetical protein